MLNSLFFLSCYSALFIGHLSSESYRKYNLGSAHNAFCVPHQIEIDLKDEAALELCYQHDLKMCIHQLCSGLSPEDDQLLLAQSIPKIFAFDNNISSWVIINLSVTQSVRVLCKMLPEDHL